MPARVLLVDGDSVAASQAADVLAREGHDVELAMAPPEDARRFDIVVVDPGANDPISVIEALRPPGAAGAPDVILTSARNDVDAAVAALHRGASDWLVKPVVDARLRVAINRALERRRLLSENERLRRDLALFAAAQRVLETLDREKLAVVGVDVLCSVVGVGAAAIWSADAQATRGLHEDEAAAVVARPPPEGFVENRRGAELGVARFEHARVFDLGDAVSAAVFFVRAFERIEEEGLLFLVRQIANAVQNSQRFRAAAEQALRDPLTGLWNAAAFSDALTRLIENNRGPFSLLFLDVDRFKLVNDRYGHLVGSRVLVDLARAVEGAVREGDVVSRYGGDELTVLLPDVDVDVAVRIADRIRGTVESTRFASAPDLRVTVCIGVASWPRHAPTLRGLFEAADAAMYRGKAAQRNQIHVADDGVRS